MNIELNLYFIIILVALSANYLLNLISDCLNLRSLKKELPPEFKDQYDAEKYRKSQDYEQTNTRFSLIVSTFNLAVLLAFWLAGGFVYLDKLVSGWLPENWSNAIVMGLGYTGLLVVGKFLLGLPFRIYETFVIEARFGFNRTTPWVFSADILKIALLALVLGAPLMAAVIAFFQYAGDLAWLYCWAFTTAFTLLIQFAAPRWIMPLFNKFTPLEEGDLKAAITEYAQNINFPLKGLYVIDGSRRSSKSNAFFTGFGKNKRIALFDTLIKSHTIDELLTILAHEIGHYKKKHILKGMLLNILHTGVLFFLLSIFLNSNGLFAAFGFEPPHTPVYAGLIFFSLLYSPIEMILAVLLNVFSRKNEREADVFAVQTTAKPGAFIHALKKLSSDNLSNLTPHPMSVFLHYSHPPVIERIRNISQTNSGD
ncbi:MAG: M48 family metallopeptidase [Lentisphaeria bacterium]